MNRTILKTILFAAFCAAASVFGAVVTVDFHQTTLTEIGALEREHQTYVSAMDLINRFNGHAYWSPDKRKLAVTLNGSDLVLTENNPYVQIGDSAANLVAAPFLENGELFVPAAGVSQVIDGLFPDLVTWDPVKKTIKVVSSDLVIRKALCEEKKNGTLYTLFLPDSTAFDQTFFRPQLNINITGGRVSPLDLMAGKRIGKVRSVEAVQFADNAQISLTLADDPETPEVSYRDNPSRIEVVIRNSVAPALAPKDSGAPAVPVKPGAETEKGAHPGVVVKIKTIILDPGHGGRDPGAVNTKDKEEEKQVVLDIALKVRDRLKEALPGTRVILTRDNDTFIALHERSKIANTGNGNLFVSIHANSVKGNGAKKATAVGYGVYFLDVARDDESRAVAALENEAMNYEEKPPAEAKDDIDFILKSAELNAYRDQSEQLAISLEQEMGRALKEVPKYKTGVSQAGFYVLRGPQMPSVLVETAFISNPKEAKLLKSQEFQNAMAQALCAGIAHFKDKCEKAIP